MYALETWKSNQSSKDCPRFCWASYHDFVIVLFKSSSPSLYIFFIKFMRPAPGSSSSVSESLSVGALSLQRHCHDAVLLSTFIYLHTFQHYFSSLSTTGNPTRFEHAYAVAHRSFHHVPWNANETIILYMNNYWCIWTLTALWSGMIEFRRSFMAREYIFPSVVTSTVNPLHAMHWN